MPVPSSYNDITTSHQLQNFVGWVWYERHFWVNNAFRNQRAVLRVDSAHYDTVVVSISLNYYYVFILLVIF